MNVITKFYDEEKRMPYFIYTPNGYEENPGKVRTLLVLVHGSSRRALSCIDAFRKFADEKDLILLAPLFEAGCTDPADGNNYKYMVLNEYRFDHIVLEMIEQTAEIYSIDTSKFLLHGFSGGGHYAHRFLYLHPDRLKAVSVGAPGFITFLEKDILWPEGVKNFSEVFGTDIDEEAMKAVPIHLVVGESDTDGSFMKGQEEYKQKYGSNRLERVLYFKEYLKKREFQVKCDTVPNVGHNGVHKGIVKCVQEFFCEYV